MLIKGGTVFDGSGNDRYRADIRVSAERIDEIGELEPRGGERVLDATGLFVTPGFVDILNHSDAYLTLFENPAQESLLRQGITTVLMGNCGSSLAPLIDGTFVNSIQKWGDVSKINVNWLHMEEYIEELRKHAFGVNMGTLIGHSTIRRAMAGDEPRALNDEELEQMKYLMERGLQQGAFGISTGLAYSHARQTDERELKMMTMLAAQYGALYSTHIRDESEGFQEALEEAIRFAAQSKANTEISHFKVSGKQFWSWFDDALEAVARIGNVHFDVYPYTATASVLYTFLPNWAAEGGNSTLLPNIKTPEKRKKLIRDMKRSSTDFGTMRIAMGNVSPTFFGKTLQELAENQNISVEEVALNLIEASGNRVIVFTETISEENVRKAIKHHKSIVSSDGVGYTEEDADKGGVVHPRYFGAMPKFLAQYVRDEKLLSWEESIRKITAMPAEKIGLRHRGKLMKGYFADLVVFDPEQIRPNADFANPYQYPEGIQTVIVNGAVSVENNALVTTNGSVLTRPT